MCASLRKIISLCDYSGSWSAPYEQAGYEVKRIDLQNGGGDVRLLMREKDVHVILAIPGQSALAFGDRLLRRFLYFWAAIGLLNQYWAIAQ